TQKVIIIRFPECYLDGAWIVAVVILSAHLYETKGKNMSIQYPGFWRRFLWAFRYFVLVLIRPEFARQVAELDQARLIKEAKLNQPAEEVVQEVPASEPVTAAPQPHTEATQAD